MSVDIKDIPLRFVGRSQGVVRIPSWAKKWRATRTGVEDLPRQAGEPGILVIQSKSQSALVGLLELISQEAVRQARQFADTHVVVEMEGEKLGVSEMTRVLRHLPGPAWRVDFALGEKRLEESVIQAAAKLIVELENKSGQRPDPLAEAKGVIKATLPLHDSQSGRLSASAIADAFGLSLAKLGQIIGRSRQALAKTPDAPAIQVALRPFERTARLCAIFPEASFRAWLNRSNHQLDGQSPLDLIADGRAEVVADLAEDMLLGTPG